MHNYYTNLWSSPSAQTSHGSLFWKNVNFDSEPYKYQESVFRDYLRSAGLKGRTRSVLELGCGNGRMTKIVLEELGASINKYRALDISHKQIEQALDSFTEIELFDYDLTFEVCNILDYDNTSKSKYDLVIASEVFMHILPKDIDSVIGNISKLLASGASSVINIDWNSEPKASDWCFIHDYSSLYRKHGLVKLGKVAMPAIKQGLFHYGKSV